MPKEEKRNRVIDDHLLTVEQFAELLNVKPATIRRWLLLGKISSVKVGRAVRVFTSERDRLIAEGLRPRRGDCGAR